MGGTHSIELPATYFSNWVAETCFRWKVAVGLELSRLVAKFEIMVASISGPWGRVRVSVLFG